MTPAPFFNTLSLQSRRCSSGVLGMLFDMVSLLTLVNVGSQHKQLAIPHFSKLNLLPCSYGYFHWCLAWWADNTTSL